MQRNAMTPLFVNEPKYIAMIFITVGGNASNLFHIASSMPPYRLNRKESDTGQAKQQETEILR
jgi:hypothetical protein